MHQFSSQHWVPYSSEQVFAFFSDPANLPGLMPRALDTRIECIVSAPGGPSAPGTEIRISFRPIPFLPVRQGWVARIVEFQAGSHFADEQQQGPFAYFRHRHGFREEIQHGIRGTVVSDEIKFALPFGILGQLTAPLVQLQLASAFAARQRRLPELLATR